LHFESIRHQHLVAVSRAYSPRVPGLMTSSPGGFAPARVGPPRVLGPGLMCLAPLLRNIFLNLSTFAPIPLPCLFFRLGPTSAGPLDQPILCALAYLRPRVLSGGDRSSWKLTLVPAGPYPARAKLQKKKKKKKNQRPSPPCGLGQQRRPRSGTRHRNHTQSWRALATRLWRLSWSGAQRRLKPGTFDHRRLSHPDAMRLDVPGHNTVGPPMAALKAVGVLPISRLRVTRRAKGPPGAGGRPSCRCTRSR